MRMPWQRVEEFRKECLKGTERVVLLKQVDVVMKEASREMILGQDKGEGTITK